MNLQIRALLVEQAEVRARISQIPFEGSIEIKENSSGKYLYARSRIAGKNTSTYLGSYSDEAYALLMKQAAEQRSLKKRLRRIERDLSAAGYEEGALSSDVLLNIDFARANIKTLIHGQAVLEGVSTTFPQTEEILENGVITGMKATDVQKILNLKHAWEFVLDRDVVACESDMPVLSRIATLVNEGFYEYGGDIRRVPVNIGGCAYIPPLPSEESVRDLLEHAQTEKGSPADIAMKLALRLMRAQAFIDGNKRTAFIFANHYLIAHAAGLLRMPENAVREFRDQLVLYYETNNEAKMLDFMKEACLVAP